VDHGGVLAAHTFSKGEFTCLAYYSLE